MQNYAPIIRRNWDLLVAASAVAAAIDIPVRLVLYHDAPQYVNPAQWIFTAIFAIDVLVHVFEAGRLGRRDPSKPVQPYAAGWVAIDLCAAIPFYVFAISPLWQLLRVLKLLRVAQRMWRWRPTEFLNPNVVRLGLFFFWLALSAHWISCGWLALRGLAASLSPGENYLHALYWCVTTLTTVGYGDEVPIENLEIEYTMVVMILGVGVYGYVIGNAAGLLANIDPARVHHREAVEKATAFMRYRSVPAELQQRILDYYEYLWEKRLGYDESMAITELPPSLRTEVSLFLHRDIIQKVPLFRGGSDDFIKAIALEIRPIIFMPGDLVIRAGEPGEEMYFISQGTVEVLSPDEAEVYATLSTGDFFGESALILQQPRTASVRALEYCDLYSLTRATFDRVLARHPDVAAHIKSIAKQRQDEIAQRRSQREETDD